MIGIHLFDHSREGVDVAAGEVVFSEAEPATVMYAVVEGEVEILRDEEVLFTVGPGELVGELALIDDSPRSATARARSAARLVPIDRDRFLFLVQQHPTFAIDVLASLAARLRSAMPGAVEP